MVLELSSASLPTFALCVLLSYVVLLHVRKSKVPYPPGPPPKPLVGNAFDIPIKKPWLKYIHWSKQYNSDIIHLSAMNMHIIVLHTMEDVTELMERRSANYSSRPASPIIKLLGMEDLVMMLPYGNTLRKQRRILEEGMKKDIVPSYHPVHTQKVHLLLEQFLNDPDRYETHCKSLGSSVTMAMTFGYDIRPGQKQDRYVDLAELTINTAGELLVPGRTMIAVFPLLRHIPPWFPGASTQKLGAQVREAASLYKREPFEYVKKKMAAGTAKDCILKRLLQRREKSDGSFEDEGILKDTISGLYLAAVESTQILQIVFIMAMALFPDQQKIAQYEIDQLTGSNRLPRFADRTSLPHVEALYREVMRWRPVDPLGFGHSTLEDDVYNGYHIPKGTIIMPNVWAITRDEAVYPDSEAFRPQRFLKEDRTLRLVDDTVSYIFGFGRRICPGRHVADAVAWFMMVSVLATFNISKAKDENGNEIEIDANAFTDAIASAPLPFKCSIVPRSSQADHLIRDAAGVAWDNLSKLE